MKILDIIVQTQLTASEPLSNSRLGIFWGIIIALVLLFIYFLYRTNKIVDARKQVQKEEAKQVRTPAVNADIKEEAIAAIALAIHMYTNELHDQESFRITLKKVSKIYSPWSSKIYTLRQNPR